MSSYCISINVICKAQDHSRLESDVAEHVTIMETLSCNSNRPNLTHLDTAVGHLLVSEVGHLDTQLLHQLEVDVGAVGRWKAGRLQDREGSAFHNKNVFLNTAAILQP